MDRKMDTERNRETDKQKKAEKKMFTINVSKKETKRHTYKYTEAYWIKTDESLKRNRDTDKVNIQ